MYRRETLGVGSLDGNAVFIGKWLTRKIPFRSGIESGFDRGISTDRIGRSRALLHSFRSQIVHNRLFGPIRSTTVRGGRGATRPHRNVFVVKMDRRTTVVSCWPRHGCARQQPGRILPRRCAKYVQEHGIPRMRIVTAMVEWTPASARAPQVDRS